MHRIGLALVLGAVGLLLLVSTASGKAGPKFPEGKIDLASVTPLSADTLGPGGLGGGISGNEVTIGANVIVNAMQSGPPAGLVGRTETTITANGSKMLAGWNDAEGFCGIPFNSAACAPNPTVGLSGYAYSVNSGQTWTDGGAPPQLGTDIITRGDPWMDDNGAGTFYYANLAVNSAGASLGISVHRGHFAGGTFVWDDVKAFDAPKNATRPDADFYDKEALVAGKGKYSNDAYVTVTNFQELCGIDQNGFGQIEVWRTHDGGNTWQGPGIAGPEQPDSLADCGNTGTLQQSSAPAVGKNGEVYVTWQVGPTFTAAFPQGNADAKIVVAKSTDGGVTFGAPVTVANIFSARNNPPIGFNRSRVNDHPRIDVSSSGRIFVTYYSSVAPALGPSSTQRLVDIQTYVKYSDDGGATWSPAAEIAGPLPAHSATLGATKRWWPDVSISGNEVHVVYLEERATQLTANPTDIECSRTTDASTRRGIYSSVVDTWWTNSQDNGRTWSMPLKLSTSSSNWCTPFGNVISNIRPNMGDYIDAEAGSGSVNNAIYALWADGRDAGPYPPFGPGNFLMAGSAFGFAHTNNNH